MEAVSPLDIEAARVSALIEEQALTKDQVVGYLRQVMEIRALENNISKLLANALLKGASHLYAGEEATAVGAVAALRLRRPDHPARTAAMATHMRTAIAWQRRPAAKQEHFNKMMAEVLGKTGGYCKGKGGSMHIADVEHGNLGATGHCRRQYPGGRVALPWHRSCRVANTWCYASLAKAPRTQATSTKR